MIFEKPFLPPPNLRRRGMIGSDFLPGIIRQRDRSEIFDCVHKSKIM